MYHNQFSLLTDRRFMPLFITQFLGAFHDNLFKSAFVAVLLFHTAGGLSEADTETKMMVTMATAVFIAPYLLFSALAGQYADKYPKDMVIRKVKLAEIIIALSGAIALLGDSLMMSFVTLFALGTQSAFFGPSKYSILPQHLDEDELIGGNALLGIGTFLAILLGTIIGMGIVNVPFGLPILSALFLVSALCGYWSSRYIPLAPSIAEEMRVSYNIITKTWHMLSLALGTKKIMTYCALGIAWFWFMGSAFLSQMPNFTRLTLGANEHVSALFMVLFSIGIGLGGLMNNRLLKGQVSARYVPWGALAVSVFAADLFFAGRSFEALYNDGAPLIELPAFIGTIAGWRIIMDVFLIAVFAGVYVIPLNAIFQNECAEENRSRMLAGMSILNAGFMVLSSVIATALFAVHFTVSMLFLLMACVNLLVAYVTRFINAPKS